MKKIIIGILILMLSLSMGVSIDKVSANIDTCIDIDSKSYILLEVESNEILVENNSHDKMPVASICKLMTTLIALEKIDAGEISLDDFTLASEYACSMEGSQAFLDAGAKYKVYDLLKSVIVASANDSSVVLAEHIAGNENSFVEMMNSRAKELGMNNTFYENANGLPTPNQYSTSYDTAILLKEISKYDLYNEFSNIWMDKLIHPSGRETELVNTNRLIKYYDYCLNGKTGFTDEAGYCLASTASNDDLKLIAVVLNGDTPATRFSDSVKLYNYGFANFKREKILNKYQIIDDIKVMGGKENKVSIALEDDCYVLLNKGDKLNVDIKYNYENIIKAPIIKDTVVGNCEIIQDGKVIRTINIVAADTIEKQSINDIFIKIVNNWNII